MIEPRGLVACSVCSLRFHDYCQTGSGACAQCGSEALLSAPSLVRSESLAKPPLGSRLTVDRRTGALDIGWRTAQPWEAPLVATVLGLAMGLALVLGVVSGPWYVGLAAVLLAGPVFGLALYRSWCPGRRRVVLSDLGVRIEGVSRWAGVRTRTVEACREQVSGYAVDEQVGVAVDVGLERISLTKTGLESAHGTLSPAEVEWLALVVGEWWEGVGAFAPPGAEGQCPYCHDTLGGELVACAACGARHHSPCRERHGRCASCGHDQVLVRHPRRRRRPADSRILVERRADGSVRYAWDLRHDARRQLLLGFCGLVGGLLGLGWLFGGDLAVVLGFYSLFLVFYAGARLHAAKVDLILGEWATLRMRNALWGVDREAERKNVRVGQAALTLDFGVDRFAPASPLLQGPEVAWLHEQLLEWERSGASEQEGDGGFTGSPPPELRQAA